MNRRREKQEKFRRIFRDDMENQKAAHERELDRRRKLSESCKPSKVRTYACNEHGYRTIQYYSYHYDFEEDTCVQKIKKVVDRCETIEEDANESDDDSERELRKSKKRRSPSPKKSKKKGVHADDFTDKRLGVHQKKAKKTDDKEIENEDVEEIQHKESNVIKKEKEISADDEDDAGSDEEKEEKKQPRTKKGQLKSLNEHIG